MENILPYAPPFDRISKTAVIAFAFSILSLLTCFLILPGLLAVFLGAFAENRINRSAGRLRGLGFARTAETLGILAAIAGIPVILLLPSRSHSGPAPRSSCAANLRGIAQSMIVYASENDDQFPVVAYAPYSAALNSPTASTDPTPAAAMASFYKSHAQAGSVAASLWILVLNGQVSPRGFICPEDPFASGPAATTDSTGRAYDNFQNLSQLSYSFAYPWRADGSVGAWWKNTADSEIPVAADMAPEDGTGSPPRNLATPALPAKPAIWNSANHHGDGQNVAFADGHAEFCRSPDIGQHHDNIWTSSAPLSTGPAPFAGTPASRSHSPALTATTAPFDIVMYPVRNATTGR